VLRELIEVTVNGQARQIHPGQSVAALLKTLNISTERVAVELNKSIVRKRDWEHTQVPSGSRIEIVEFVGGG
jgi:thiamine biosynthesis protein ThiS